MRRFGLGCAMPFCVPFFWSMEALEQIALGNRVCRVAGHRLGALPRMDISLRVR
jgi:hypothetical protein